MKGHMSESKMAYMQLTYVRRIYYIAIVALVCMIGLTTAMVVILAAGAQQADMLTQTGKSTVQMRDEMVSSKKNVENAIADLRAHFPDNQAVITSKQILETVDNIHKITARTGTILEKVDPLTAASIATHVDNVLGSMSKEQITSLFASAIDVIQHVGKITEQADQQNLIESLNSVIKSVQSISQQVDSLHKVTVDWGSQNKK